MSGRKKAVVVIPIVVVAVLSLILLWPNLPNYISYLMPDGRLPFQDGPVEPKPVNNTGNVTDNGSEKITIRVLSDPSAFPFVDKWEAQYNIENRAGKVQIISSDEAEDIADGGFSNVSEFLSQAAVDQVITGIIPSQDSDLNNRSDFQAVSPQVVAIVYNVPGFPDLPSGLKLDPTTLSAILGGNATFWDDPRIVALNPGTALPHEEIAVVYSPRERSSSQLLEQYVSSTNNTILWQDTGLTADNPSDVAALVRRTPNSLGYVEFAYAIQTRMTYAALGNSDGDFVMPSIESIGKAVMNGTIASDDGLLANDTGLALESNSSIATPRILTGNLGNGSYPLVGFYYVASRPVNDLLAINMTAADSNLTEAYSNLTESERKSFAVNDFIRWVSGDSGQKILEDLQYPSIYEWSDELAFYRDERLT